MCGVEGGRRVGGFTMPPHVLPDLKRDEPAVTPAVQRPASVIAGSGDLPPPHPAAILRWPWVQKPKAGMKKSVFEMECEFEVLVKSPLWLLKEKVVGGCYRLHN